MNCAGGVAVKRHVERFQAQKGRLVEAMPVFEAAEAVAKAGVLLALPAIIEQGLFAAGEKVYGGLKSGFFGLTAMLMTFVFMTLLRIRSVEALPSHVPGEFGRVLGLDRAPEIRTARRKLKEMGLRGAAASFAWTLATMWAKEEPETLGYLYVDGHVRPYHGRTHRVAKAFVPRRRLCMPATTDVWINDACAHPLFFVTCPGNDGLLSTMETSVLPSIRDLVGSDRRVTLVFDREGWSPGRFAKWFKEGFDVLTYRKGAYEAWPEERFVEKVHPVLGRDVTYRLAEGTLEPVVGFKLREVRRLCETGHQTSVVTTRWDLPAEDVARRMFSRWDQENFFRYMRQEFAVDRLPTNMVEPADPERDVPNPARREKERELRQLRQKLARAKATYGARIFGNKKARGSSASTEELAASIASLAEQSATVAKELKGLPKRVRIADLSEEQKTVVLEPERKMLMDTIKIVAYRAETQLANLVGPLLRGRGDEARDFIKQALSQPADLIPDQAAGTLTIRIHGLANWRSNRALAEICQVLTEQQVSFPNSNLRLVFLATNPESTITSGPGL